MKATRRARLFLCLLPLACLPGIGATGINGPRPDIPTTDVIDLDPLVIIGREDSLDPGSLPLHLQGQPAFGSVSLARQLAELPGVSLASRGAHAEEPVIRGLGFDRVATRLNGLRLPNAAPTRTHAPAGLLSGLVFQNVSVSRFLPSLDAGPPVSGGWISLESRFPETDADKTAEQPRLQLALEWIPDRDGTRWTTVGEKRGNPSNVGVSVGLSRSGNYTSGGGSEVAAHHESLESSVSLHLTDRRGWTHSLEGIFQRQLFTENAALPLDTDDGQLWALTSIHTLRPIQSNGSLRLRFGYTESEATLSNERRPDVPAPVLTKTFASSMHADLQWRVRPDAFTGPTFGVDFNLDRRNAIRRRGFIAEDAIWPDIKFLQAGAYAQSILELANRLRVRMGARLDYTQSRAGIENKSAFGKPLASLYSRYNGEHAADTRKTGSSLSAGTLVTWSLSPGFTAYGGAGTTTQAPPPTERYRAFLNALGGGFEVGNPDLSPEHKQELVAGILVKLDRLTLQADLYFFEIDDFIWRQRIGSTEGLLPVEPGESVFGYRNVDASFHGLDVHGSWQVRRNLELPFSLSWNQAELRQTGPGYGIGTGLPEVPPAEASIAAVYFFNVESVRVACRWTMRHTACGKNPLPDSSPLYADTRSHTRHDLSVTLGRGQSLTIDLSILNLFNRNYFPYLSPPVSSVRPGSGDLAPGDRIPGPGREIVLSCRVDY